VKATTSIINFKPETIYCTNVFIGIASVLAVTLVRQSTSVISPDESIKLKKNERGKRDEEDKFKPQARNFNRCGASKRFFSIYSVAGGQ
jgi:hypothetical protein